MKTGLFQFCGHCWVSQTRWHTECSTCTALSLRVLSSAAGVPSPLLALFIVMLSKAHLTSHSRMSGSVSDHTIVIILVMKLFFVQFFCVFLPPRLNIFCFCSVHTISVLYRAHPCMKYSLGSSNFLEEIFLLIFPVFLCTDHWGRLSYLLLFFGTLHSNGYIFPFLLCFHFSSFHSYL